MIFIFQIYAFFFCNSVKWIEQCGMGWNWMGCHGMVWNGVGDGMGQGWANRKAQYTKATKTTTTTTTTTTATTTATT